MIAVLVRVITATPVNRRTDHLDGPAAEVVHFRQGATVWTDGMAYRCSRVDQIPDIA